MKLVRILALSPCFLPIAPATAACGGADLPLRNETSAVAAIRSADELGAEHVPVAAFHLELAREQLRQARAFFGDDENELATGCLRRAQVDAELAIALSREEHATRDARDVQRQIQNLRAHQYRH